MGAPFRGKWEEEWDKELGGGTWGEWAMIGI